MHGENDRIPCIDSGARLYLWNFLSNMLR
uniref:Uncharacterized protein n=1 Tax=Arundo donax TaxID=35708 RepID=A0A0A9H862_ARUDO